MKQKVTIDVVARKAGVSPGTVSKALNGRGSPATREKVAEIAKNLGYRPNFFARAICSPYKECIGVLASTVTEDDPWVEKILPATISAVSESGYRCMADFWKGESKSGTPEMLDSVDGCILLGDFSDDFFPAVEREYGLPLVTVSEKMPYGNGISLQVDWNGAVQDVVQYLLAHQHTQIGLVVYGTSWPSLHARYKGFIETMSHFEREVDESLLAISDGQDVENVKTGRVEYMIDASMRLTKQLLQRRPDVTAIVFGSDLSAFGGIEVLREKGYRVPEDISIAAFDNTDWGRVMNPALTTAGVDYRELSLYMIETLEGLVAGRGRRSEEKIRPHLVKRKSIVRAPSA